MSICCTRSNHEDSHDTAILQLCQELNKSFSQAWHDVGGVMQRQSADELYSNEAVFEHLVVQCNEKRSDILCLSKVFVEALV